MVPGYEVWSRPMKREVLVTEFVGLVVVVDGWWLLRKVPVMLAFRTADAAVAENVNVNVNVHLKMLKEM